MERNPSFNPDCPACVWKRIHSTEDWENHPLAGHGFTKEQGYSSPIVREVMEKEKLEFDSKKPKVSKSIP